VNPGIIIIVLELKKSFVEGKSSCGYVRKCVRISMHVMFMVDKIFFTFQMRYMEYRRILLGVIGMCISEWTLHADDRLSIPLNFGAAHVWNSAFDPHVNKRGRR
jgi:hypothetical protein